jgi:hypothetical protein
MSWWISLPPVTDSWQLSLRHLTLQPCHFSAYNINTNLCILLPHISTHTSDFRFSLRWVWRWRPFWIQHVWSQNRPTLETGVYCFHDQGDESPNKTIQHYIPARRLSSSYQHILQWIPTQVLHHWTTAEVHNFLTPLYIPDILLDIWGIIFYGCVKVWSFHYLWTLHWLLPSTVNHRVTFIYWCYRGCWNCSPPPQVVFWIMGHFKMNYFSLVPPVWSGLKD